MRLVLPCRFGLLLTIALLFACGKPTEEPEAVAQDDVPPAAESVTTGAAPVARIETVTDSYHGTAVADPYRWLENWDDENVKAWSEAQNAYARGALAGLPERPVVHARITEILKSAQGVIYSSLRLAGPDRLFAMKRDPAKQQSILVFMGADGDPVWRP